jgi:hypothetical protein
MARKAPIITLDELKAKLDKYINPDLDGDDFPYNLPEAVHKDIAKVEFDFENWSVGFSIYTGKDEEGFSDYLAGYCTLPSGIPVLLMNAGGDWEFPICFAIYFDGKGLRAYIPEDGNSYNKKLKSAWGNNSDEDIEDDEAAKLVDRLAILNDINTRITVR